MNAMKIFETVFALGVLINLFKLGDMILRPQQKKKFEEVFETFTLWLDDIKPINWFNNLVHSGKLQYALTLISVYILVLIFLYFQPKASWASWEGVLQAFALPGIAKL